MAGDALAKSNVTQLAESETFSKARVDLIKRTVCPKGITDDEFALFIEQCKRAELDPLMKEAFCVPRRKNIGDRDRPQWIESREFQPSDMGLLSRADKFSDFRGVIGAAVYENDEFEIDQATQTVTKHISKPHKPKERGALVGAWAQVIRDGRTLPVVYLAFSDYSQNNAMWNGKGPTMIFKCARTAAMRLAFPRTFGNCFAPEELGEDDLEMTAPPEPAPKPAPRSATARVVQAVEQQAKALPSSTPAATPIVEVAEGQSEDEAAALHERRTVLWKRATDAGMKETFLAWAATKLGGKTPRTPWKQWTAEDCTTLEAAFEAMEPPDSAPDAASEVAQ